MKQSKTKTNDRDKTLDPPFDIEEVGLLRAFIEIYADPEWNNITGYPIDGVPLSRHPDNKTLIDKAVKYLKEPNKLANLIKEDPFCISRDNSVIISLYILNYMASGAKTDKTKWAEDFLKILGLTAFIPKQPKNRTKNTSLHAFKKNPKMLLLLFRRYKHEILEYTDYHHCIVLGNHKADIEYLKPHGHPAIYKCCLKSAYWTMFQQEIPDDFFNFNLPRNIDITILTLRFMSCIDGISFDSLYKFYYSVDKSEYPIDNSPIYFNT